MAIFLCYRRSDTKAFAGRLDDHLRTKFGVDRVYRDVDSIPLGVDFLEHISHEVGKCDVFIAVIGSRWVDPRLFEGDDVVRIEIESALTRAIPVIPVLVDGASMPSRDDLPKSLHPLLTRHGIEMDSGSGFKSQLAKLSSSLEVILGAAEARKRQAEAARKAEEEARQVEERERERAEEKTRQTEERERQRAEEGKRQAEAQEGRKAEAEEKRRAREKALRLEQERQDREAHEGAEKESRKRGPGWVAPDLKWIAVALVLVLVAGSSWYWYKTKDTVVRTQDEPPAQAEGTVGEDAVAEGDATAAEMQGTGSPLGDQVEGGLDVGPESEALSRGREEYWGQFWEQVKEQNEAKTEDSAPFPEQ